MKIRTVEVIAARQLCCWYGVSAIRVWGGEERQGVKGRNRKLGSGNWRY